MLTAAKHRIDERIICAGCVDRCAQSQPSGSRRVAENVRLAWAIYSKTLPPQPSPTHYLCTDVNSAEPEEWPGSVHVTSVSNYMSVHYQ